MPMKHPQALNTESSGDKSDLLGVTFFIFRERCLLTDPLGLEGPRGCRSKPTLSSKKSDSRLDHAHPRGVFQIGKYRAYPKSGRRSCPNRKNPGVMIRHLRPDWIDAALLCEALRRLVRAQREHDRRSAAGLSPGLLAAPRDASRVVRNTGKARAPQQARHQDRHHKKRHGKLSALGV